MAAAVMGFKAAASTIATHIFVGTIGAMRPPLRAETETCAVMVEQPAG